MADGLEAAAAAAVDAAAPEAVANSKRPMSATFLWLVVSPASRRGCESVICAILLHIERPCNILSPDQFLFCRCPSLVSSSLPCNPRTDFWLRRRLRVRLRHRGGLRALPSVRVDLHLTIHEAEWFVSSTTLAAAFTSLISPPATGAYGRRPMIILAGGLFVMGGSIVGGAADAGSSIFGRSILGVAVGLVASIVPMYVAELSPRERRGATVMLYDLSIVLGQLLAGFVDCLTFYTEHGWRLSMGIAVAPAFGMLLALLPLPESPRWLVRKGRLVEAEVGLIMMSGESKEAREAAMVELNEVRETIAAEDRALRANLNYQAGAVSAAYVKGADDDDENEEENAYNCAAIRDSGGGLCGGGYGGSLRAFLALWGERPLRRAALLGVLMGALNQLSGINTIMYYAGTIFTSVFKPEVAVWLSASCDGAQLLGVCLSLLTIDSHGRRRTALRSCFFVTASLVALALTFMASNPDIEGNSMNGAVKVLIVTLIMIYLVAFGSGLSGVGTVIISEIYPMRVRGVGIAQATFISWMCNYLVSQTFLTLTASYSIGYAGAFDCMPVAPQLAGCCSTVTCQRRQGST